MKSAPRFQSKEYSGYKLLREARGVETWEVQGQGVHHLLKISQDPSDHFKSEYDFLSQFRHPGFPKPIRWSRDGGNEIYLREYLEGLPLAHFFGKLDSQEMGRVLAQILRALACLHYQGLAHGDLSGSNILVDNGDRVVLIDWEFLSKRHQPAGVVRGTPTVMAPELFWGRPPTIQTDLYSFGCLMYALIAGRYPFKDDSFSNLLQAHALEDPMDPTRGRPEIPTALGWIALRLLAKEPGSRFAEANDVIQAINRVLDLKEKTEPPPTKISPQQRLKVVEVFSQQQEAVRHLQGLASKNNEEFKTLAELLLKGGCLKELEELLSQLPADLSWLYRGLLLNRRGQYQESLRHWEKGAFPHDSRVLLGQATAYYYAGHLEKALDLLEKARDPSNPKNEALLKNSQGNLFFYERRLPEADRAFERALELARDSGAVALEALVRMNLANVQTAEQRWEQALDNYTKASEIYAALGLFLDKAKCDLNLSGLLRFFGHLERAEELLQEVKAQLQKTPQSQLADYLELLNADLKKKRGEWRDALEQLHRRTDSLGQSSASDHGDFLISQAEIFFNQGADPELLDSLKKSRLHSQSTEDSLLMERVEFLEYLRRGLEEKNFDAEEILLVIEKLKDRGDVEFILDNLLSAKVRAFNLSLPWSFSLHRVSKGLTESLGFQLPPDYQSFFRQHYRKLIEVPAMNYPPSNSFSMEDPRILLSTVLDWVRELTGELRLPELSRKILEKLLKYTRMERGFVILKGGDCGTILNSHRISTDEFKEGGQEQISWSLTRQAFDQGKPLATTHASADPRLQLSESISDLHLRSILVLPFHFAGKILGAVYLDSQARGEHLESSDLPMLESLAEILGLAVDNAFRFEKSEQALEEAQKNLAKAQHEMELKYRYEGVLGRSEATRQFLLRVDKVTDVRVPVLIEGESGVGKELVARAIHFNGSLRKHPFVTANCSSIPEGLVESELFGHERGAFTGAIQPKTGLFEQADGGTLFLDEIGDMPLALQAKLLRVLQEGEVRRLGSTQNMYVQVRILAATHRDLKEEIRQGRFREDLFYRLNVAAIQIPPLRNRLEDIPLLVNHFLEKFAKANRVAKKRLSPQALAKLMDYQWPGNIRELENLVYNLCIFSASKSIELEDLIQKPELAKVSSIKMAKSSVSYQDPLSLALDSGKINLSEAKRRFEKREIERVLDLHQGRVGAAANQLGILRPQLSRLISYYKIKRGA